jgi:hypothetical protein
MLITKSTNYSSESECYYLHSDHLWPLQGLALFCHLNKYRPPMTFVDNHILLPLRHDHDHVLLSIGYVGIESPREAALPARPLSSVLHLTSSLLFSSMPTWQWIHLTDSCRRVPYPMSLSELPDCFHGCRDILDIALNSTNSLPNTLSTEPEGRPPCQRRSQKSR